MRSTVTFVTLIFLFFQCAIPKEKIPPVPEMQSSGNKIVIYQMMPRLFSNTKTLNKANGTLEENGVGKFEDINDKALEGIKELGITHIWYTGIIEHALATDYSSFGILKDDPDVVKGKAGSPFSIKDYYDVNPDLAIDVKNRMLEFDRLVSRTHDHGLKVIIDFVGNHVARVYQSDARPEGVEDLGAKDDKTRAFDPANNFYYIPGESFKVPQRGVDGFRDGNYSEFPAKATGNDHFTASPSVNDWFESVKLNYGIDYSTSGSTHFDPIPDTWNKMRDILLFWAGKKVDGFRCDMAQMVPTAFWHWVIPQVKAVNPELIFIAEIYEQNAYRKFLEEGRFDYLYDKVGLYDALRLMIGNKGSAMDIVSIQRSLSEINPSMVHFLENHDEQRIASPFFAGNPLNAIPGMVVSSLIDKGPVMIYFGQEVGEPAAGTEGYNSDDGTTTKFDYWGVPEHQKWVNGKKYDGGLLSEEQRRLRQTYAQLLTLASTNEAFSQGEYFDLTTSNVTARNCSNRIVSFMRVKGGEKFLVLAGFNVVPERIHIRLTSEAVAAMGGGGKGSVAVWPAGLRMTFSPDYSFEWEMPAYGYFVFKLN